MANSKETLQKQLADLLASYNEQGFLDSQYAVAQAVKQLEGSFAFLEFISNFRNDCQSTIKTLALELEQPLLDYADMKIHCMRMKGSTSCVGARRMALACTEFSHGIHNKSKEQCLLALEQMKQEFQALQEKFDRITQLERRILSCNHK